MAENAGAGRGKKLRERQSTAAYLREGVSPQHLQVSVGLCRLAGGAVGPASGASRGQYGRCHLSARRSWMGGSACRPCTFEWGGGWAWSARRTAC
eukprot:COSAG02_NODE_5340_length_4420_cov_55.186103_3_plen_95_part_00